MVSVNLITFYQAVDKEVETYFLSYISNYQRCISTDHADIRKKRLNQNAKISGS